MPFPFALIDFVAVLVAVLVNFFVGMFWFSKAAFGNAWIKALKITTPPQEGMARAFTMAIISNMVSTIVISIIVVITGPAHMVAALTLGILLWLGVAMPIYSNEIGWEHRSPVLVAINAGWTTVSVLMTVAILYGWPW